MNDHTSTPQPPGTPDDPNLTAYALGELEPGTDVYQQVEARLANDPDARAFVQQARTLADQLTTSFRAADGSAGLSDHQQKEISAMIDQQQKPNGPTETEAPAPPPLKMPRKLLLAAGLALAATAAITTVTLMNGPDAPELTQDETAEVKGLANIQEALATTNVAVDFEDATLGEVFAFLHKQTGVAITADWESLEKRGISAKTHVTLKHDDLHPAATVLAYALQSAWAQSPHPDNAQWSIGDDGVTVAPKSALVQARLDATAKLLEERRFSKTDYRSGLLDAGSAEVWDSGLWNEMLAKRAQAAERVLAEADLSLALAEAAAKIADYDAASEHGLYAYQLLATHAAVLQGEQFDAPLKRIGGLRETIYNAKLAQDKAAIAEAVAQAKANDTELGAYESALFAAGEALNNKSFQAANDAVIAARAALLTNREQYEAREFNELAARTARLHNEILESRYQSDTQMLSEAEDDRRRTEQNASSEAEKRKLQEVTERLAAARQFQQQDQYDQALGELDEALILEPDNLGLTDMRDMLSESKSALSGTRARRGEGWGGVDQLSSGLALASFGSRGNHFAGGATDSAWYADGSTPFDTQLAKKQSALFFDGKTNGRVSGLRGGQLNNHPFGYQGQAVISGGAVRRDSGLNLYDFDASFALNLSADPSPVAGRMGGVNHFQLGQQFNTPTPSRSARPAAVRYELGEEARHLRGQLQPELEQLRRHKEFDHPQAEAPRRERYEQLIEHYYESVEDQEELTDDVREQIEGLERARERVAATEPLERSRIEAMHELRELERRFTEGSLEALQTDPQMSRDAYATVNDNPFKNPGEMDEDGNLPQAISTFSVDVDTAAYSLVRRQLMQQRQLPVPGAIRIEEMINYFDYGYDAPIVDARAVEDGVVTQASLERFEKDNADFAPFATHVQVTDCPWTAGNKLVRIGIKGMDVTQTERPTAHLTFLLDVSGSMGSSNKLPLVKESIKLLLDKLNDRDRISIVVYAGRTATVMENVSATDRPRIEQALHELKSGGSTAGAAGIQLAYDAAQKHFIDGGVNRVILCTDGDFNVGISDTDDLVALIKQKANPPRDDDGKQRGVYLSVLGYGMGNLNDAMMEPLTNAGNGTYAYIDTREEAQKVMYDQAGATLVAIAKDVKVQVHFDPEQVMAYRLIGYENRILATKDFDDDTVDAGDIGAGHSVTALYEVVPFLGEGPALDDQDIREVKRQIDQLEDAIALNSSLMQTCSMSEADAMKLQASNKLLAQELVLCRAAVDKHEGPPEVTDKPKVGEAPAVAEEQPNDDRPEVELDKFEDGAMMSLRLRYKPVDAPAEQGSSRRIDERIFADDAVPFSEADESTRFAAAVAGFGMVLRSSPHAGTADLGWVLDTANDASGHDPDQLRAQFIELVGEAMSLMPADEADEDGVPK